jgi:hypothetical protein
MKAVKLKTIVLLIWGAILLLSIGLGFSLLTDENMRAVLAPPAEQATASDTPRPATKTATAGPAFVYLPSATARAATAIPVTPSPSYIAPLPMLQYVVTLPANANPLTGLIPDDPAFLNRRPVAVKISSFPRKMVRMVQSGLTQADLVYEYYIEDGLTRFIAVYYSKDASRAGPVRSGRYFDEYIMRMYHSSLVFGHADKRVEDHLLESDLRTLLFEEQDRFFPPLWNSSSGDAETKLFVDTAGVGPKLADNSRQEIRASLFASLLYPQALPAIDRIYTHYSVYSYNYWEYDPARQVYMRFSDAADALSLGQGEVYAPHFDTFTGMQLTSDNVVVLVVPHIFHNEFDREDQVIDISLNGSGDAYVFRNGRMIRATWSRDRQDQPFQLTDEKGFAVPMKPGNTYYQVIDPESTISQPGTSMDFRFFIPLLKVTPTPTPYGWEPSPTPTKVKH